MPPDAVTAMDLVVPAVADRAVAAIVAEVPGYVGTLDAGARVTLGRAVEVALRGFLALAGSGGDPSAPMAQTVAEAHALGRGEARAGRSMDALLAAYRVGARVSWRGLADAGARAGLATDQLVGFAELVFAYIDALSAASVAGHAAELASEDRVRGRRLERLGHGLVSGGDPASLQLAAERAQWSPPDRLVPVLLPEALVDQVLARIDPRTLQPAEDVPGLPSGVAVLLVPDPEPRLGPALDRLVPGGTGVAVLGPALPWAQVADAYRLALRALALGLAQPGTVLRADDVLAELVVGADPHSLAELRARALAPFADLPPAVADRLTATLRAWLLHRGRRDAVAAALFVHPQTVRYRMAQVRALLGERLDDPRAVLELTIALALPTGAPGSPVGRP
ncbi:MAG: helix-turn-helix domain-containing protein [Candidatus Nanopelagicales bacterium]|nr:helix-turn-helix domain-containing protein [Candidatus Nanopelagicales bacterium]